MANLRKRREARRNPRTRGRLTTAPRSLGYEPLEDRRLLAVVTVDTNLDVVDFTDGVTSLREAIFATNLVGGHDEIRFDFGHDGPETILLTQGELQITDSLTITGPGAELLTIDASGNDPTPDENNGDGSRVFYIDDGSFDRATEVELSGLALTGGDAAKGGGGILSKENLSVISSTVSDNSASTDGGGIMVLFSKLDVESSSITGNVAGHSGRHHSGGGIYARGSHTSIAGSIISGNTAIHNGGGIGTLGGTTTVSDSLITANKGSSGGGLYLNSEAAINNSKISNNFAALGGGGIHSLGGIEVVDSDITRNTSNLGCGGLCISSIYNSNVFITNRIVRSNFSNNTARSVGAGAIGARDISIEDCIFFENYSGGAGGGISVGGNVSIENSSIISNTAQGHGGGIHYAGDEGMLSVLNCTIKGNRTRSGLGGGISSNGQAKIENSLIESNSAALKHGGGVAAFGVMEISNSVITGNAAKKNGGGIYLQKTLGFSAIDPMLRIANSLVTENYSQDRGGGIYGLNEINVRSSTLSNNHALLGGAIYAKQRLVIDASTVSGNTATTAIAGVYARKDIFIRHTTITANGGPTQESPGVGLFIDLGQNDILLDHVILAGNLGKHGDLQIGSTRTFDIHHSLIGDNTGSPLNEAPVGSPDANGNLIGGPIHGIIDPLLGPLADNGGPTKTHALLPGSPAINAGDLNAVAGVGGVPEFDQRGPGFDRVYSGRIDIGAYEVQELSDLNLLVDTLVDESDGDYSRGDLSLREAIELANANPVPDTIRFDPILTAVAGPLPATILLTMGELKITDSVDIQGPGAELLTIDAGGTGPYPPRSDNGDTTENTSRVFFLDDSYATHSDILISGLNVTGGLSNLGGGILSFERLTLSDVTITDNHAYPYGGGGIFAYGPMILIRVSVFGNTAQSGPGGGIHSRGSLQIVDSVVSGNTAGQNGGGVHFTDDSLRVSDSFSAINSTFTGNRSGNTGGGIYAYTRVSTIQLADCVISSNFSKRSGAGVYATNSWGEIDFTGLRVEDNQVGELPIIGPVSGGGIFAQLRGTGGIRIAQSSINGNLSFGSEAHGAGLKVVSRTGGAKGIVSIYGNSIHNNLVHSTPYRALGGAGVVLVAQQAKIDFHNNRVFQNRLTGSSYSDHDHSGAGMHVYNSESLVTISDSTFEFNRSEGNMASGGGLGLYTVHRGTTTITGSTISNNYAGNSGGGVHSHNLYGTVEIINSTISGNSARNVGGGLALSSGPNNPVSKHRIANSTLTENVANVYGSTSGSGGGLYADFADLELSIVAGNLDHGGTAPDIAGIINSSYSLIGIGAEFLGPLADNGGPTLTHALLPGSPAIDAGDPSLVQGMRGVPEFDQRGAPYGRVAGRIDIGAFEVQPPGGMLRGDFDGDADTDGFDFLAWQRGFGKIGGALRPDGDGTDDGDVDNNDEAVWEATFGTHPLPLPPVVLRYRIASSPTSVAREQLIDAAIAVATLPDRLQTVRSPAPLDIAELSAELARHVEVSNERWIRVDARRNSEDPWGRRAERTPPVDATDGGFEQLAPEMLDEGFSQF